MWWTGRGRELLQGMTARRHGEVNGNGTSIGVWTDDGQWIAWDDLCLEFEAKVFVLEIFERPNQ